MRFVCDSCRAQYMISDDKVGAKGVKVRCKKCGYVILVRRADAAASAPAPAPLAEAPQAPSSDDAPAETGGAEASASASSAVEHHSGQNGAHNGAPLSGVLDDEIGAVFDQVLKSGPHPLEDKPSINSLALPPEKESLDLGMDDDLASTRAVSTDALKKLVAEAEAVANGASVTSSAPPANDWYVAIDEQQQGPLTFDAVRDLWDRGELGPDSLCWRGGMADWIPLSEVTELAAALAPKPSKPVVVAAATSQVGTVVSVPVETSVNVGGVSRTVRSEHTFGAPSMAASSDAPAADTGGWKPSAASALAALVSEEMTALSSKPKAPSRSLLESGPSERPNFSALDAIPAPKPAGLFDIPSAPHDISGGASGKGLFPQAPASDVPMLTPSAAPAGGAALTQSPQQPYAGPPVYGAAPYTYTPPSTGMSKGMKIGIAAGSVVVLGLVAALVVLLSRGDEAPAELPGAAAPVAAVTPPSAPVTDLPMPPPPPGMEKTQDKPAETAAAAPAKPAPVAAAPAKPEPVAAAEKPDPTPSRASRPAPSRTSTARADPDEDDGDAIVARSPRSDPPPPSGGGDDFDKLFGGESKPAAKAETSRPRRKPGYIPPPPGGGDLQESLGQSDIMQVVLSNKPDIVKCVNDMKAREPGISGKLVVRWTIRPSGSTTGVSVRSGEFKNTYMARCMIGLVKGWKFPRHRNQGPPIDFPFTF